MDLLRRIRRLWRLRAGNDGAPEEELQRLVDGVAERLGVARAEVQQCQAEERRLADLAAGEARLAVRMRERARRALCGGREDLAREALKRHVAAARQAERYEMLHRQQQEGRRRLDALLEGLEAWQAELEHRRRSLATRRQLGEARRTMAAALHNGRDRARAELAEERVLGTEYLADAYQALVPGTLAETIDALGEGDPVEEALAALRNELAQLPPRQEGG